MNRIRAYVFSLLILFVPVIARCDISPPTGRELHVFLVTFGPGSDPWEKFGHDCIVIEDNQAGTSLAYNWGVFDFGQGVSGFLTFGWHFLQGRLLYSMQSAPTGGMLEAYKAAGRSVFVQELGLTSQQKLALKNNLEAQDTEANRYYLYDYFKKNCTTMARDAIDQTIGGRIATTLKRLPTQTTYRWHDRRTTADDLWLYVFLDFALGHDVDRPMSAWDECFLPAKLEYYLNSVAVPGPDGKLKPLVIHEQEYAKGPITERDEPPIYFFLGFLGFGIGSGILFFILGSIGIRFRVVRWLFTAMVMLWSLLAGLLGALLTFAWFTNHEAAKWNENWLQGNPVSLLLIVLAPLAFRWPKLARYVAFIALGLSAVGLIAKLTPWFWQVNGQIIAAALPIHAGIAWGIYRLTTRRLTPVIPTETANTEARLPPQPK